MKLRLMLLVLFGVCGGWLWHLRPADRFVRTSSAGHIINIRVSEPDIEIWHEEFLDSFWDPPMPRWVDRLWEPQLAALHRKAGERAADLLYAQLGKGFPTRAAKEAFIRARLDGLKRELLADRGSVR